MVKIYIDLSKPVPNNVLKDVNTLIHTMNEHHSSKLVNKMEREVSPSNDPQMLLSESKNNQVVAPQVEPGGEFVTELQKPEATLTTTTPTVDAELDCKNMPWDARIHAKAKTKNKDGSWRYKRGVDKNLVTEVEAAIKVSIPAPEVHINKLSTGELYGQTKSTFDAIPMPQEGVKPNMGRGAFKMHYMETIAGLIKGNKIDRDYVMNVCRYLGVNDLSDLKKNNDDEGLNKLFDLFVQHDLIKEFVV